jgi:hypothetical protein
MGEAAAQAIGFRPESVAQTSEEHMTMENVRSYFKGKKDYFYVRYKLAKTDEDRRGVIRDMQKFNMEARKYKGVIPPISATSLRESVRQRPEKPFTAFWRMFEVSP